MNRTPTPVVELPRLPEGAAEPQDPVVTSSHATITPTMSILCIATLVIERDMLTAMPISQACDNDEFSRLHDHSKEAEHMASLLDSEVKRLQRELKEKLREKGVQDQEVEKLHDDLEKLYQAMLDEVTGKHYRAVHVWALVAAELTKQVGVSVSCLEVATPHHQHPPAS